MRKKYIGTICNPVEKSKIEKKSNPAENPELTFRGNVKERGSQADQVTQNQQKTGCLNSFARCVATSTSRLKQVALIVSRVEWTAVEEP